MKKIFFLGETLESIFVIIDIIALIIDNIIHAIMLITDISSSSIFIIVIIHYCQLLFSRDKTLLQSSITVVKQVSNAKQRNCGDTEWLAQQDPLSLPQTLLMETLWQ